MKYIRKKGCPHGYAQWCRSVAGTDKSRWSEMPSGVKGPLLGTLLSEQGQLCAYTMRRIERGSSHIEHIKPQSRCRAELPGSDLYYVNLVACFPADGMHQQYRYGAQKKDNWWEHDGAKFISPLQPKCEQRFRFDLEGEVVAVNDHAAAMTTIEVLGLNHKSLIEDRQRAITELIYGPDGREPLSPASAQRLRRTICDLRHGYFYEFCVALKDALSEYLSTIKKLAKRRIAARRAR